MRSPIVATVLAFATLVAVPVFAAPSQAEAHARAHHGGDKDAFPIPAAAFKAKVDTRMTKARERMEARASKLPADEAKAMRATFDAGAATVNAEVAKAIADGTVTKDEAQAVRETVRAVRAHHGKHARR